MIFFLQKKKPGSVGSVLLCGIGVLILHYKINLGKAIVFLSFHAYKIAQG